MQYRCRCSVMWRLGLALYVKAGGIPWKLAAQHFGEAVPADQWAMVVDHVMGRSLGLPPTLQAVLTQVDAIATRERFFHWELEFPELYFDRYGRPLGDDGGFEAVIGNQPYVRQEQLAPYKPYFQADYAEVYHGVAVLINTPNAGDCQPVEWFRDPPVIETQLSR